MRILQIASEMTCVAKVGGLGDVLMGLSRELLRKGHDVLAILPAYGCVETEHLSPLNKVEYFDTTIDGCSRRGKLTHYVLHNTIPVALLDTEDGFFSKRESIYGQPDDASYFLSFSRAVCEWLVKGGAGVDVVHTHDWPTALLPQIYRVLSQTDLPFRSVFTIHNFEYQGWCSFDNFQRAGLYRHDFASIVEERDQANLLKGGMQCSDYVTTVSPTYAQEILHNTKDITLQKILQAKGSCFVGILNGVDYSFWNPETDPYLQQTYGRTQIDAIMSAKDVNKRHLFSKLGLQHIEHRPLVVCVTRLVYQKGIDLIASILQKASRLNIQCLVVGSVPDDETKCRFEELDASLRSNGHGAVLLKNNERLAHQAYSAADYVMVPSIYEPCGLTQLIALRYGAIPIVRSTGGLADTISDVCENPRTGNGFSFHSANADDLENVVVRALDYCSNVAQKRALILRAMGEDFSWSKPCERYERLYSRYAAL